MTVSLKRNPTTPEGRPIVQPVVVGDGQWHYWHSIGDSSTALRAGTRFKATQSSAGDATAVVWQYRDPVWMAGGELRFSNAQFGDYVSFTIYAPATPVVANESNLGNCNLVFPGIIVPAGGDGAYDVDLNDAYPVPSDTDTGFWDYTLPSDYKFSGTIDAAPNGDGGYHLIAARQDLVKFVAEEQIIGTDKSIYEPSNIKASLCLPEWRFEFILHNDNGSHTVEAVWRVLVSRVWTTM